MCVVSADRCVPGSNPAYLVGSLIMPEVYPLGMPDGLQMAGVMRAKGFGHETGQLTFPAIPKRAVSARSYALQVLLSSADSAYSSLAPAYPEIMHITSATRSHDMQAAHSGTDQLLAGAPIRVPSSPSSTITVQVRPTWPTLP